MIDRTDDPRWAAYNAVLLAARREFPDADIELVGDLTDYQLKIMSIRHPQLMEALRVENLTRNMKGS